MPCYKRRHNQWRAWFYVKTKLLKHRIDSGRDRCLANSSLHFLDAVKYIRVFHPDDCAIPHRTRWSLAADKLDIERSKEMWLMSHDA